MSFPISLPQNRLNVEIICGSISFVRVGAFDDPRIRLTEIGKIVERNLLSSENISGVKIDHYVIMPDHIHAIVFLDSNKYVGNKSGSSKAPTPTCCLMISERILFLSLIHTVTKYAPVEL